MKKKLILFLISAVLPFCCSSCGIIDIAAQLSNTDSSETKISSEEEFTNYVEQQFEEKYGKEFELIGFSSPFMSISRDCDIKCVDDGIEFQATVHSKDYYEVEKENYLCYKYLNQMRSDIELYMNNYLYDYKYVSIKIDSIKSPFETSHDLTYEELRKLVYFECIIYMCNDRIFSDDEMKIMEDKFGGYGTEENYKEEIDMRVNFHIYLISKDIYNKFEYRIKDFGNTGAESQRLI